MTTIERPVVTAPARHHHPAGPAVLVAAIAAAGAAGLLAGVLTSYLQGVLPHDWNQLANSGAVWTVFAFAVALLCAGPAWAATTAGGVTLVAEVVGYYAVASPLRHIPTTHQEQLLWCVAALWIGPAAGYAAWCVRRGESPRRLVAALAVAGVAVSGPVPWTSAPLVANYALTSQYAEVARQLPALTGGAPVAGPGELGALAYYGYPVEVLDFLSEPSLTDGVMRERAADGGLRAALMGLSTLHRRTPPPIATRWSLDFVDPAAATGRVVRVWQVANARGGRSTLVLTDRG